MNVTSTKNILGILSSFQTLLDNYPKLLADDAYGGKDSSLTAISFMLDILKIFGVSDEILYKWLSNLLLDEEDSGAKKGLLIVLEESIKVIILTYLTGLYTCPIDPVLPDYFLRSPYIGGVCEEVEGNGIDIPINRIDAFGLLQNCPTSIKGSVFYFDTSGYTQSTSYKSNDFNSYLWFVINKGNRNGDHRSVWDNRNLYRGIFKNEETGQDKKDYFIRTECECSPSRVIKGVGIKNEILYCEFWESGYSDSFEGSGTMALNQTNFLRVWGVADRYYRQGLKLADGSIEGGRMNKTIFQFNTDYVTSLKLFDSKTLVAQIINAILGIYNSLNKPLSFNFNLMARKVERMVEKVIEQESYDDSDFEEDGYFIFSDEEYNQIENDATLRYLGKYETGNDTNDYADIDIDSITTYISEIDNAGTPEEKEDAIMNALIKIGGNLSLTPEIDYDSSFFFNKNIILKFIKEAMIQIAMQVMSPKIVLLFNINARFLEDTQEGITESTHWEDFFKNFWNILTSCIRKIVDLVIQALLDMIIGQLKPIISLIVKKLMLETIYYYRILLEELIANCVPALPIGTNTRNMVISNVNYADIIPVQKTPPRTR